MQCPFDANNGLVSRAGHGLCADTSTILFKFLNADIAGVNVNRAGQIDFDFGAGDAFELFQTTLDLSHTFLEHQKAVIGANSLKRGS